MFTRHEPDPFSSEISSCYPAIEHRHALTALSHLVIQLFHGIIEIDTNGLCSTLCLTGQVGKTKIHTTIFPLSTVSKAFVMGCGGSFRGQTNEFT